MITNEQNLIVQTYANVALLFGLKKNNFIESDYFNKMEIESWLKDVFKHINVDNQGALLMILYGMIVVPKELIANEFTREFEDVEKFLKEHLHVTENSYKRPKKLLQHIRNAIAHANIEFKEQDCITFYDEFKEQKFTAFMYLKDIESFLHEIKLIHFAYVKKAGGIIVR